MHKTFVILELLVKSDGNIDRENAKNKIWTVKCRPILLGSVYCKYVNIYKSHLGRIVDLEPLHFDTNFWN